MTNEATKNILLGKNIQKARKSMNYSQNKLADVLNISREHLAKIETAKRGVSINLLFKLSEVLNVSEKEFFEF